MAGRESVFSDDRVIELLTDRFIPVADNCSYTQTQQDAKGEFFRLVAEQGHYAGRTKPTATRQGLYACTSDGELLASINTTDVERALEMMRKALATWEAAYADDDLEQVAASYEPDKRYNRRFPEGGMILRETIRDLPRVDDPGFDDSRHNFDYVWFTKEEAMSLVPAEPRVGAEHPLPDEIVRRIAQFHLVDQARGEAPAWREEHIRDAQLALRIVNIEDGIVHMRLEGRALLSQDPTGQVNPFSGFKIDMERKIDAKLVGAVVYDQNAGRFTQFDMLATGTRWGATVYNGRKDDLGPAPIGFAFELLPDTPENRTPPKFVLWDYFRDES